MTNYVQWTREEIEPTLRLADFVLVEIPGVKELVFERPINHMPNVSIRIYTSICGDAVRGVGQDAARVNLIYKGKHVWKSKRVHRTKNFLVNLIKRCRDAYTSVCLEPCAKCGKPMVLRYNKKDSSKRFWGCSAFPECKYTANIK